MEICAIAFDADDTLWHSQTHFEAAQARIDSLLAPFAPAELVADAMRQREDENLLVYGYGVKAFILARIEAAISVSDDRLPPSVIRGVIEVGRDLLSHPVELLPGVQETLGHLMHTYKLALITKGEATHQEAKLASSGIAGYFSAVSIVASKSSVSYLHLAARLNVAPSAMLMVGNSVRSDILPALEAGCHTAYVPYPHVWRHELAPIPADDPRFVELTSIEALPEWLAYTNGG